MIVLFCLKDIFIAMQAIECDPRLIFITLPKMITITDVFNECESKNLITSKKLITLTVITINIVLQFQIMILRMRHWVREHSNGESYHNAPFVEKIINISVILICRRGRRTDGRRRRQPRSVGRGGPRDRNGGCVIGPRAQLR